MKRRVSIVFPVYNEEGSLSELYERVRDACSKADVDYEMVFVDNGSSDGSLAIMKDMHARDSKVVYCSLSRNFGHQGGLFCGLSHAGGDAVITMDADLQHPPELIPEMIGLWLNGIDVVYTTKRGVKLPFMKRLATQAFYWFISKVSKISLSFGQSDFRLVDKKVLQTLLSMPEYHKFLRGQIKWIGFRQQGIEYDVHDRVSGSSKFSYRDLFLFALDGLFSFSSNPLRLLAVSGFVVGSISFMYSLFVMTAWFLKTFGIMPHITLPPGWVMTVLSVSILGSVQLIALGVLGEYIGRIFEQSKSRPVFIVKESSLE